MNDSIYIGSRSVGAQTQPFMIAEMSGNHNQSIEKALQIVEAAAKSGADALKIQTYTPDTMTLDISENEFCIKDEKSLWKGESLYSLYAKAYTPWEWHEAIFKRARQLGMIPFSTPFDSSAVDFLESLSSECYKIASFENTDLPLIRKVAKTGKPIIMSTGMATLSELGESVSVAREAGCKDLILLKCTSTYPAEASNTNIKTISHMRELFGCQIGLSDHTMGVGVAVASVALGATVIEKHFTMDRSEGGVDSSFSLEPEEFAQLVVEANRAWESLGCVRYGPTESELGSLQFRRSLYIVKDLVKGEILSADNVRAIRPGLGLPTKYLNVFIGRRVMKSVKKGTPVSWDLLA
jgi:N-acetylneuraminate synthase